MGAAIICPWLAIANAFYGIAVSLCKLQREGDTHMNLSVAEEGRQYTVRQVDTDDEELNAFLFSLGCYSGEPVTVVSRRKGGCTVSIKDGRYNIDDQLASAILI